jgi:hypothetical protein
VIVIPFATLDEAKVNTGVPPKRTSSEPTTPTNVGVPVAEADSPRSNSLFTPVNPETVKPFGVTVIAVESDEAAR